MDLQVEVWKCELCGGHLAPCKIEIVFSNSKLPTDIANQSRFRRQGCICGERNFPEWVKQKTEPYSPPPTPEEG